MPSMKQGAPSSLINRIEFIFLFWFRVMVERALQAPREFTISKVTCKLSFDFLSLLFLMQSSCCRGAARLYSRAARPRSSYRAKLANFLLLIFSSCSRIGEFLSVYSRYVAPCCAVRERRENHLAEIQTRGNYVSKCQRGQFSYNG